MKGRHYDARDCSPKINWMTLHLSIKNKIDLQHIVAVDGQGLAICMIQCQSDWDKGGRASGELKECQRRTEQEPVDSKIQNSQR